MYLLARHFQVMPLEALNVRPAWELELLLEGLAHEEAGLDVAEDEAPLRQSPPTGDPFAEVPTGLRKLKERRSRDG